MFSLRLHVSLLLLLNACFSPSIPLDDASDDGKATTSSTTATSDASLSTSATSTTSTMTGSETAEPTTGSIETSDSSSSTRADTTSENTGPTDPSESTSGDSTTAAPDESRIVFLIPETVAPADFGGLEGADAICQSEADAAGLEGTFLAWLSTSANDDPESRFSHAGGPFVRTDGIIIAEDWADLTDGELIASINHNAAGEEIVHFLGIDVVTATAANGTHVPRSFAACGSYTADYELGEPDRGNSNEIDGRWSAIAEPWDCGIAGAGLYCFQQ